MIRINLLPFRAARKKENIRRQVSYYLLSVVLVVAAIGWITFMHLNPALSKVKKEKQEVEEDLKTYQEDIKRANTLEKKIAEIKKKLDVIKDLEKKKTGPVFLLDQIAMAVPRDKLWLTSFVERKGKLTLSGTAMDNETVALFMTSLEKADLITAVDLKSTKSRSIPQHKLRVSDFSLECTTYAHKEEEPKPRKRRRK